jgi:hypothetical protein
MVVILACCIIFCVFVSVAFYYDSYLSVRLLRTLASEIRSQDTRVSALAWPQISSLGLAFRKLDTDPVN